ncbi:hypothetical protein DdX_19423 [Ditylenchus destructor]|uniref:Uncharacterized protein n=1 Tax=Ditylenchus destructor TaxID=166010 RepID=A0AAD4MIG5_9BILA|nr:hypothetical protein DdX_19423 [Ditylenchus destructor]
MHQRSLPVMVLFPTTKDGRYLPMITLPSILLAIIESKHRKGIECRPHMIVKGGDQSKQLGAFVRVVCACVCARQCCSLAGQITDC